MRTESRDRPDGWHSERTDMEYDANGFVALYQQYGSGGSDAARSAYAVKTLTVVLAYGFS